METTFLMSRQEAARSIDVCLKTFDDLVKAGKIPAVKIGSRSKFRPEDLREFAERGTRESANA